MKNRREFVKTLALGVVASAVSAPALSQSPQNSEQKKPLGKTLVCTVEADYKTTGSFLISDDGLHPISFPKGMIWIQVVPQPDDLISIRMFRDKGRGLTEFDRSLSNVPIQIGIASYGGFTLTALEG